MVTDYRNPPVSKMSLWAGRIVSTLPVLVLLMSATMKLYKPPMAVEGFAKMGWPIYLSTPLAIVEITCTLLYIIPPTSILGAILLTGYLGGATATHVRIGEPFFLPVVAGILVWLGLFLRDRRLRVLIPLKK